MANSLKDAAFFSKLDTMSDTERNQAILNHRAPLGDFYAYQLDVLYNFKEILDVAQHTADMVGAMRSDTANGGAGPSMADVVFKLNKVKKHIKNATPENGKPVLVNSNVIHLDLPNDLEGYSKERLRDRLRNSPTGLGFMQAFNTLGLEGAQNTMMQYFPHFNKYFVDMMEYMEDNVLNNGRMSVEHLNNMITEFFSFYMSQYQEFAHTDDADAFIKSFPRQFVETINKRDDLANLSFVKNIKFTEPTLEVPIAKLKYLAGGVTFANTRDKIISE